MSEGLDLTRSLAYASGYYFEKSGDVQLGYHNRLQSLNLFSGSITARYQNNTVAVGLFHIYSPCRVAASFRKNPLRTNYASLPACCGIPISELISAFVQIKQRSPGLWVVADKTLTHTFFHESCLIVIDAETFGQLPTLHNIDFRTCLDRMLIVAMVSVKHSSVVYKYDWLDKDDAAIGYARREFLHHLGRPDSDCIHSTHNSRAGSLTPCNPALTLLPCVFEVSRCHLRLLRDKTQSSPE